MSTSPQTELISSKFSDISFSDDDTFSDDDDEVLPTEVFGFFTIIFVSSPPCIYNITSIIDLHSIT